MVINMKVKIEKLDYYGRGICHIDGKVCFVPNTLDGEEVIIEIVEDKKKYMIGIPIYIPQKIFFLFWNQILKL